LGTFAKSRDAKLAHKTAVNEHETAQKNVIKLKEKVTLAFSTLRQHEQNYYVTASDYVKKLKALTKAINYWYKATDIQFKDAEYAKTVEKGFLDGA